MDPEKCITENFSDLVESVSPTRTPIWEMMVDQRLVTINDARKIQQENPADRKQMWEILGILQKRPAEYFETFLCILINTGHQPLVKKIAASAGADLNTLEEKAKKVHVPKMTDESASANPTTDTPPGNPVFSLGGLLGMLGVTDHKSHIANDTDITVKAVLTDGDNRRTSQIIEAGTVVCVPTTMGRNTLRVYRKDSPHCEASYTADSDRSFLIKMTDDALTIVRVKFGKIWEEDI